MKAYIRLSLVVVAMLSVSTAAPEIARACGGCFSPPNPTGTVSVVSAHRMAFLSSPSGSILWDQIQYTGSPADFVWVLPVSGTPTVEVADNGFFEALALATQITMVAPTPPRTFCPSSSCGFPGGFGADAAASDAGAASDTGPAVHVFHEGVVGPYETATIGSTDPMALVTWLHDHGYEVNSEIEPTIAYYVGLGMNFVALRLAPTSGIDRMTPVRIATPGLALSLPLRMIAAGVGSEVQLELFVFAESRMEAANFGNAEVDRAAITFDWASRTFDYDARFDDAMFRGTGVLNNWVSEYAQTAPLSNMRYYSSGFGADMHSAMADTDLVIEALPNAYLTRLRTRLPPSQLGTDLTLRLSTGADIGTYIRVTRELHRAPDITCPPPPTCPGARRPFSAMGGGCAIGNGDGGTTLFATCILIAVLVMRRRRLL